MREGDRIGPVALRTAAGDEVTLQRYLDVPRVISAPRYYG